MVLGGVDQGWVGRPNVCSYYEAWGNPEQQTSYTFPHIVFLILAMSGALFVWCSIRDSCRWHWHWLTNKLPPLRQLMRVMGKHDLTNILTILFWFFTIFYSFDKFGKFLYPWPMNFQIFDQGDGEPGRQPLTNHKIPMTLRIKRHWQWQFTKTFR